MCRTGEAEPEGLTPHVAEIGLVELKLRLRIDDAPGIAERLELRRKDENVGCRSGVIGYNPPIAMQTLVAQPICRPGYNQRNSASRHSGLPPGTGMNKVNR